MAKWQSGKVGILAVRPDVRRGEQRSAPEPPFVHSDGDARSQECSTLTAPTDQSFSNKQYPPCAPCAAPQFAVM